MRKHLVLVGGGHAHMITLENIGIFVGKGYKVTVIAPSFYHYYSGMGPGMLGGTYGPDDIRFATKAVVVSQGGVFVKDRVIRIDPVLKQVFTLSGNQFSYDVISFNSGSFVPLSVLHHGLNGQDKGLSRKHIQALENVYPVKPIEKLMEAKNKLTSLFTSKTARISVVGGGPSSAEIAGNAWQLAKKTGGFTPEIRVFAGRRFMARFAPSIRNRIVRILGKRGIQILEKGYVDKVSETSVILDTGEVFETDFTFMALGVAPSDIFQASGLPMGPDGGLMVNQYLQSTGYPEIFGGGDCIHFKDQPLDKVGVYAVRENPILFHNLMAALEGSSLKPFDPGGGYLLIFNLGGAKGVLRKGQLVFGGKPAFWIKDYIDRKFIKRFQIIER